MGAAAICSEMVARGGPIREANQDSAAARRARIDTKSIQVNRTTDTRIFSPLLYSIHGVEPHS